MKSETISSGELNPSYISTDKSQSQKRKEHPEIDVGKEQDVTQHETWDKPIEFLLSCVSMSVGLGNVWRFPFVVYSNGGGAFLIPYLIVLMVVGRPLYYLEMCIGQFSHYGQVKMWNMAPIMKGVGWSSLVACVCGLPFMLAVIAQTIFYFFASFAGTLPWTYCDPKWGGTELCLSDGTLNSTVGGDRSVAEWYYRKYAFPQYENIDGGIGLPNLRLTGCLAFSWLLIFFSIWKGVKSSGKVAYFTSIFPYIVLVTLFIRGITLDGAADGIIYLIKPQWDKLLDPRVWYAAVSQCFFSLSIVNGAVVMLSSHNEFRHNTYKDAMIISVTDTFTSLLAGFTIFAVLGYLSKSLNIPIEEVTSGGPGLAFVSYPEALSHFPVPQLFSVLFFLMLITLGMGSSVAQTNAIVTVFLDKFPKWRRDLVGISVCAAGFLLSLMFVTPGGSFLLDLMNEFTANFVLYVLGICEIIGIAWIYGLKNVRADIEFMLGRKVGWYWRICWGYIIPGGLTVIFIYYIATMEELTSGGVKFPKIAIVCGWLLAAFLLLLIPVSGMHSIMKIKTGVTLKEKIKESFKPTRHWGPQEPKLRAEWLEFKEQFDQDDNRSKTTTNTISSLV